jgi:hypothetical protein
MINLIRGLYWKNAPIIRKLDDLQDPRGHRLGLDNFVRVRELPSLYEKLANDGGILEFKISDIDEDVFLKKYNQVIAGSILHYELTKRIKFQIPVKVESVRYLRVIKVEKNLMAHIKRSLSVERHENLAQVYEGAAKSILNVFEAIKRNA